MFGMEIITPITSPTNVAFLDNDTIVIAGKNGFALYKPNNEIFIVHSGIAVQDLAINKAKTQIAVSDQQNITIYNKDGSLKWKRGYGTGAIPHFRRSIVFNSQNDNQILSQSRYGIHFDTIANSHTFKYFDGEYLQHIPFTKITCHPHTKKIIYNNTEHQLYVIENSDYCKKQAVIINNNFITLGTQYNPSGSLCITNNGGQGCFLYDAITGTKKGSICSNTKIQNGQPPYYSSMVFHPNCITLALLARNNTIEYWHCGTMTLTHIEDLSNMDTLTMNTGLIQRLACSPNGKKILVALSDKCFILPIPFKVRFLPEIQKKIFSLYCLLKNYDDLELPMDIIDIIIKKQLRLLLQLDKY